MKRSTPDRNNTASESEKARRDWQNDQWDRVPFDDHDGAGMPYLPA